MHYALPYSIHIPIGGGNLRIEHRFEKWYFGILLIGAFFIVSVFGGDLVDSVVCILNPKMLTFKDLAEMDTQIHFYIDPDLDSPDLGILEMLRLLSFIMKIITLLNFK